MWRNSEFLHYYVINEFYSQVDHLTKKPQNGERCLKEIQSILVENDISPFEVFSFIHSIVWFMVSIILHIIFLRMFSSCFSFVSTYSFIINIIRIDYHFSIFLKLSFCPVSIKRKISHGRKWIKLLNTKCLSADSVNYFYVIFKPNIVQVYQSGLVLSLLTYLTKPDTDLTHPSHTTTPTHQVQDHDVGRMTRVRTFLHVFTGAPKRLVRTFIQEYLSMKDKEDICEQCILQTYNLQFST